MKRLAVLALVAGVLAILGPAGAAPTTTPSTMVGTTTASEMTAAIGDDGTAAVVWTDAAFRPMLTVHRPGGPWSVAAPVTSVTDNTNRQRVTVSSAGVVDVVWEDSANNTVYTRRMDAAGSWEPVVSLSPGANTPTYLALGGNANGDVAVAWVEFSNGSNRAFVRVRRAGSATWTTGVVVSLNDPGAGEDSSNPKVVVDPAGAVVVGWGQMIGGPDSAPRMRRLPAGSSTWSAIQSPIAAVVSTVQDPPIRLAVDAAGNAVMSVVSNAGHVWAAYWDPATSAVGTDLGAGQDASPAFLGTALPAVARISGNNLGLDERAVVGTWSTVPLWSDLSAPTLVGAASDGHGRVLATLKDSSGHLTVNGVAGGSVLTHEQLDENAFNVYQPAMNSRGDAVMPWYGFVAAVSDYRPLVRPYDITGPTTSVGTLPTWTLGSTAVLGWKLVDTWATSATSVVSRNAVPVATTGASSALVAVPAGATSCFSVHATDPSGNTGAESGRACTAAPFDDRSLAGKSRWRKLTGSAYYHHTALSAKAKGRALSFRATATRLALVAKRCGTCGSVKVLVNGVVVRRINLKGTSRNQVVYPIASYAGPRTVKVKVVTMSGKKVVVDGLGVGSS